MECKWELYGFYAPGSKWELIDTLWNVNTGETGEHSGDVQELIDTLWNVNELNKKIEELTKQELIDTLWNVNMQMIQQFQQFRQRINRYIMECKYRHFSANIFLVVRINRYIMECK